MSSRSISIFRVFSLQHWLSPFQNHCGKEFDFACRFCTAPYFKFLKTFPIFRTHYFNFQSCIMHFYCSSNRFSGLPFIFQRYVQSFFAVKFLLQGPEHEFEIFTLLLSHPVLRSSIAELCLLKNCTNVYIHFDKTHWVTMQRL